MLRNGCRLALAALPAVQRNPAVLHLIALAITVGNQPHDVAITPDRRRALVTHVASNTVSVIDLTSSPPAVVATLPVGSHSLGVASRGGRECEDRARELPHRYGAGSGTHSGSRHLHHGEQVAVLDLSTFPFTKKAAVAVGRNPGSKPDISANGLAVGPNSDDGTVSIIADEAEAVNARRVARSAA